MAWLCHAPFVFRINPIPVMSKMKTHSGAAKRLKVTGSGKIKHKKTRRRHLLRKRTTANKRHLRVDGILCQGDQNHANLLLVL